LWEHLKRRDGLEDLDGKDDNEVQVYKKKDWKLWTAFFVSWQGPKVG